MVLCTAALLPVSRYQLESSVAFVPVMIAIVACLDVLSVYLRGMTASLGVSGLRDDDATTSALLRRVDGALYRAKETGRNCVVVAQVPVRTSASLIDAHGAPPECG